MKQFLLLCVCCTQLVFSTFSQDKQTSGAMSSNNTSLQVATANGTVEGTLEKSGVRSFKGIPFAAPPIGDLRWKEPQPVKNWDGVRQTKQFGPRAMQAPIFGDMGFRSNGMSEDCLYLNVWTPAKNSNEKLPVLVYFYGGGFVAGDGSEARYDGESMAQKGMVALTVNYRLGVFGLLAYPELTQESPHHSSGNYGLMDQAAAIQWVKNNIAAFGGDPDKITIAGESAGSISVSAQMASPLAKNLIAGAIGESGSLLGALSAVSLSQGEQTGVQFAQTVGANSLADLRALHADSLLNASTKFGPFRFAMTVDGYFFPKEPLAIFQAGEQAHVPLLVGWNSEEMNYRMVMGNEQPTKENYEKAVNKLYGDSAAEVLKVYRANIDADVERVATELASDRFIAFSTWRWADLQAKTGGKPVYRYYYTRPRPAMTPAMGNATAGLAGGVQKGNTTNAPKAPLPKGAVHSAEIEYAMGNLPYNKVYAWTPDDYAVSKVMQAYFANFIKNGNPNSAGLPQWPATTSSNPVPVMQIDVHPKVVPSPFEQRYHLMEQYAGK
ncbi:carboxylesterase family protein [Ilyomonas limi]|uniref:Carboxylic ester hydrolase n=1 Tax=Ilyomonas limi TaxID=2575867 RepID=A0A4U3L8X4_9BACT|nr:carboxylesterase family protein [Ilyomonas limi]TKK71771.1 carboxylesterase family protein [Ilyomonas limi]